MKRHRYLLAALVAAATVAFIAPAGAGAATTVGSTFVPTGFQCQDNVWQLQTTSPSNQYVVPSAGVLTSWSHLAAATNPPADLKLEVGRLTATPNQFLIVGVSAAKVPVADTMNTYTDISIPVQAGDHLGLHSNGVNRNCGSIFFDGYTVNYLGMTDPGPGAMVTTAFTAGFRLDISATLEADCDADGLGDETEDADLASCAPPVPPVTNPTPLTPAKKKCKKGQKLKKGKCVKKKKKKK